MYPWVVAACAARDHARQGSSTILLTDPLLFRAPPPSPAPPRGRLRLLSTGALLGGILAMAGCGGGGGPSPVPSGPRAGGVVNGRYMMQVQPGPGCDLPRGPISFPMQATPAGAAPHPGAEVVLEGDPTKLELEFLYTDFTLRGGLGTTGEGALSNEGLRFWMHAIGTGSVAQAADGRGEVAAGTLMGYLAAGGPNDEEGALGTCSARDHTFTLRVR